MDIVIVVEEVNWAIEAEILLEKGKHRSVLNRVYYSMFYAVLALLASKELTAAKHSGVISLFHRELVKTRLVPVEIAKILNFAFDLRNKSDFIYRHLSSIFYLKLLSNHLIISEFKFENS